MGALAALAIVAAPASATSLQTASNGQPYTGVLNMALSGNMTATTDLGSLTCNSSPVTASVTNAGGTGGATANGTITVIDFKNTSTQSCTSTFPLVTHLNNTTNPPWPLSFNWTSDAAGTSGATKNGTVTLSGVQITADFDMLDCTYRGDFNNTGGGTNLVEADFFNSDNSPSAVAQIRLTNELLDSVSPSPCPGTAQLSATYNTTGAGAVQLQLRENPPAPPASSGGTAGKAKKCKKRLGKKGAVSAKKKKCKKKKKKR